MNHNKLTLIIFFIAYPIYLDISIEEDVNLIAAIVTFLLFSFLGFSEVFGIIQEYYCFYYATTHLRTTSSKIS